MTRRWFWAGAAVLAAGWLLAVPQESWAQRFRGTMRGGYSADIPYYGTVGTQPMYGGYSGTQPYAGGYTTYQPSMGGYPGMRPQYQGYAPGYATSPGYAAPYTSYPGAYTTTPNYYQPGGTMMGSGAVIGGTVMNTPQAGMPVGTTQGMAQMPSTGMSGTNAARITVMLPTPDAQVWIEGNQTRQTGTMRTFESPPLQPGQPYHYNIRARWQQNGQTMDQTKAVDLRAGAPTTVTFPTQDATGAPHHAGTNPPAGTDTGDANRPPANDTPANPPPGS